MRELETWRRKLSRMASRHPRRAWALGVGVLLAVAYPFVAGELGGRVITSQLSQRLGVPGARGARAGRPGVLPPQDPGNRRGEDRAPLATPCGPGVDPVMAGWGAGTVKLVRPIFEVDRGGPKDNVGPVLAKLEARRARPAPGGGQGGGCRRW